MSERRCQAISLERVRLPAGSLEPAGSLSGYWSCFTYWMRPFVLAAFPVEVTPFS
jgi:hypothetical protein